MLTATLDSEITLYALTTLRVKRRHYNNEDADLSLRLHQARHILVLLRGGCSSNLRT